VSFEIDGLDGDGAGREGGIRHGQHDPVAVEHQEAVLEGEDFPGGLGGGALGIGLGGGEDSFGTVLPDAESDLAVVEALEKIGVVGILPTEVEAQIALLRGVGIRPGHAGERIVPPLAPRRVIEHEPGVVPELGLGDIAVAEGPDVADGFPAGGHGAAGEIFVERQAAGRVPVQDLFHGLQEFGAGRLIANALPVQACEFAVQIGFTHLRGMVGGRGRLPAGECRQIGGGGWQEGGLWLAEGCRVFLTGGQGGISRL